MDEAREYLKKARQATYTHFKNGFASVSSAAPTANNVTAALSGAPASKLVAVDITSTARAPALPMKRKRARRGDDSSSDEDEEKRKGNVPSSAPSQANASAAEGEQRGTTQKPTTATSSSGGVAAASSAQPKRLSLLDKYFPGTTLKQATLDAAQAPTDDFVQSCVQRMTAARERVIFVRSGVEDVDALLAELRRGNNSSPPSEDDIRACVNAETWSAMKEALLQFADADIVSLVNTRRLVIELYKRKADVITLEEVSIRRWHEFVDCTGPETAAQPTLSQFVWLSCANTTALFTVITQRFLRRTRESNVCAAQEVARQQRAESSDNDADEEGGEDKEVDEEEEIDTGKNGIRTLVPVILPPLSSDLPDAQRRLLHFLRYLMPISHAGQQSAGYGVWLVACLSALDTPLDPDTDRLVHDLFRTCCDQVRVLGEWKGVHGNQRGALANSLATAEEGVLKLYERMEDVNREEVLALYTIIVVLAKFFRQNQNRLIPF